MSIAAWQSLIERRIDARYLRRVRLLIGCAAVLIGVEQWAIVTRVLDPERLQVPYFPFVPLVSPDLLTVLIFVWLVAAILFMFGRMTVVTGMLLVGVMSYTLIIDQQGFSNHLYLLILLTTLATIAEATRTLTVEGLTVAYGPLLLMKLQLTIVYAYSAFYKINPVFLSGEMIAGYTRSDGPLTIPATLRTPDMLVAAAIVTIVLEAFLSVAFWIPALRRTALILGLGLHALLVWTALPSEILALPAFGLTMAAMYTTFMPLRAEPLALHLSHRRRVSQVEGIS